jgi:hypothetical protein
LIADALARAVGCGKPALGCGWLWSAAGGERGAAAALVVGRVADIKLLLNDYRVEEGDTVSGRSLGQIVAGYGVILVSLASYRSPPKARRKRC